MYGVVPGSLPPVLVPGLDLRVREVEGGRELHAVLHAQVLLSLEAALELGELVVSERRSRLPGFLQPHLRAVPAARDLPVALLLHWGKKERGTGLNNVHVGVTV